MKAFDGYNETKVMTDRPVLPAGAYPITIMAAEEKVYKGPNGEFGRLEISFDISDGEFKGFFADDYRSQNFNPEDQKWKGVLRLYVPSGDGSKKDETTKSIFKTNMTAIEESNSGYRWEWKEETLKGKKAVCVFRNEEWDFQGRTGWKAQPFKLISTEQYANGKYKLPNDKPLANKPSAASVSDNFEEILSDDDLPF